MPTPPPEETTSLLSEDASSRNAFPPIRHRGQLAHAYKMAVERIKQAVWGPPSQDRSLVWKLDCALLPYFSLIWFLFGISRASYSSAYISGMKDDLGFRGNDYNLMNTIYTITYAVFQIPSTSILTVARPKYVFVAANVTWSILTLVTFRMTDVRQIFVLNAFEGAFSAIAL